MINFPYFSGADLGSSPSTTTPGKFHSLNQILTALFKVSPLRFGRDTELAYMAHEKRCQWFQSICKLTIINLLEGDSHLSAIKKERRGGGGVGRNSSNP